MNSTPVQDDVRQQQVRDLPAARDVHPDGDASADVSVVLR